MAIRAMAARIISTRYGSTKKLRIITPTAISIIPAEMTPLFFFLQCFFLLRHLTPTHLLETEILFHNMNLKDRSVTGAPYRTVKFHSG